MPNETVFAKFQYDSQIDVERREKHANKSRTMMWKYDVQKTWNKCRFEEVQKLFDRQPMIMRTRIESEGKRKNFEKKIC